MISCDERPCVFPSLDSTATSDTEHPPTWLPSKPTGSVLSTPHFSPIDRYAGREGRGATFLRRPVGAFFACNFRRNRHELDIVATRGSTLLVVEVKRRRFVPVRQADATALLPPRKCERSSGVSRLFGRKFTRLGHGEARPCCGDRTSGLVSRAVVLRRDRFRRVKTKKPALRRVVELCEYEILLLGSSGVASGAAVSAATSSPN